MKITTSTSHNIIFTVEAFWDEEGGMGQDQYGDEVQELPEAIKLLELARVAKPKEKWLIVCHVETVTK